MRGGAQLLPALPGLARQQRVRMIDQGSSELSIIIGVEDDDHEKAVRAIYGAFA